MFLALPAAIGLVYGIHIRDRALIAIGSGPLFVYFLIGFRSIAVVALVSAIFMNYYRRKLTVAMALKPIGICLALVFALAVYKRAYIPIKRGTFDFFQTTVQTDSRFGSTFEFIFMVDVLCGIRHCSKQLGTFVS